MADSGVGRNNFEILKTLLAPAKESVALDIALHFEVGIEREGIRGAIFIHLHGMIDHQFCREQWIDFFWIAAEMAHGIAHGRQVHHGRDAREILKQDARRHKGNFFFSGSSSTGGIPPGEGTDIVRKNKTAVFMAKQIFEQDLEGEGKAGDVPDAGAFKGVEAKDIESIRASAQR